MMRLSDLTDERFQQELAWLQETIKNYADNVNRIRLVELTCDIKINGDLYNSPFARRLRQVWEYAADRNRTRPSYTKDTIEQLKSVLWVSPWDMKEERISAPPIGWESSALGFMVMATEARIKYAEGLPLTPLEMSILANLTRTRITQLVNSGEIKGYKVPGVTKRANWMIPADEVRKFLTDR